MVYGDYVFVEPAWLEQSGETGIKILKMKCISEQVIPLFGGRIPDNIVWGKQVLINRLQDEIVIFQWTVVTGV